ncbi:MAG: replication initiation protein [Burkholderiaceae bacterium]
MTNIHSLTLPENDLQISMSNAVARSAQGLSLFEKRTVALAMGKTDSMSAQVLHKASLQGWSIKLNALDYAESWQIAPQNAYVQLKEATEALMHRQAAFKTETRRGQKIIRVNWVSKSEYHEGEGWVEIKFTPDIAPHLLGLRTKFTSYKLAQAGALRSLYAWRMLELFTSWQDKGKWTVDVEDFADAVEAPESCRKDFGQLRRRIIEPAIRELREKDNWLIAWEPIKAGRRVSGLSFHFSRNPQQSLL